MESVRWHNMARVVLRVKRFAGDRDGMLLDELQQRRPHSKELDPTRLHAGAIYNAIRATCVAIESCPETQQAGLVKIQRLAAELARRNIVHEAQGRQIVVIEEEETE